jgi:hypothetical protein
LETTWSTTRRQRAADENELRAFSRDLRRERKTRPTG